MVMAADTVDSSSNLLSPAQNPQQPGYGLNAFQQSVQTQPVAGNGFELNSSGANSGIILNGQSINSLVSGEAETSKPTTNNTAFIASGLLFVLIIIVSAVFIVRTRSR